eukprot:CAMPEP_0198260272 /NCGR_PEP_ID=MMETSP1447-20131203/9290_1 /TAXON_ID=420782 /ORGANISM="Chaetoceros dichaeta, Strain CCMP1751" /LENGTH=258 /DNA_ID=CAMNT_0043947895 /DNA_START=20 /DNA_END=793 /DNA_ORIENTATION=-
MSVLRSGFTVTYAAEKKEEQSYTYPDRCVLRTSSSRNFSTRNVTGFSLKQSASTRKITILEDTIDYSTTPLLDDSFTCGERSDESSIDSSSKCSCASEAADGEAMFVGFEHVNNEEETKSEIKSHAASIIQNSWYQWTKKEKARKQFEMESRASRRIINARRTWSVRDKSMVDTFAAQRRQKDRKENIAVTSIQPKWKHSSDHFSTMLEKFREESIAATTIQSNWKNYRAKVAEEALYNRRQNMVFATGIAATTIQSN